MVISGRGHAGFPSLFQTECLFLAGTNYTKVRLNATITGDAAYQVGTADDADGTNMVWEEITLNTALTLGTPNVALFIRIAGDTGAILTKYKLESKVT